MPLYTFQCDACHTTDDKFLSISDFIGFKKNIPKCEKCDGGYLHHKIHSLSSNVERSNDQIILDIQEEVSKTVNKISNGNHRAIEDIYGDRPNPYK